MHTTFNVIGVPPVVPNAHRRPATGVTVKVLVPRPEIVRSALRELFGPLQRLAEVAMSCVRASTSVILQLGATLNFTAVVVWLMEHGASVVNATTNGEGVVKTPVIPLQNTVASPPASGGTLNAQPVVAPVVQVALAHLQVAGQVLGGTGAPAAEALDP